MPSSRRGPDRACSPPPLGGPAAGVGAERGGGVAPALLDAAVEHARARGATTLEGYPVDAADGRLPSSKVFTGTVAMFARAGFAEFGRPRGSQLVVRRDL